MPSSARKLWFAFLVIAVLVSACRATPQPVRPRQQEVPMPPVYAAAQHRQISYGIEEAKPVRIITYQTNVAPAVVADFYRTTLPNEGWEAVTNRATHDLHYSYYSHEYLSYTLYIQLTADVNQQTQVEVHQIMHWSGHSGHGWSP